MVRMLTEDFIYPVVMPALAVEHESSRRMKNATARLPGVDLSTPKRLNGYRVLQVVRIRPLAYYDAGRP